MNSSNLCAELTALGRRHFEAKSGNVEFTNLASADRLVNSLQKYPHAFVIACLMDKQLKAERAWKIPYEIRRRSGSFEFEDLVGLSERRWAHLLSKPTPLHRFPAKMGAEAYLAVQHISVRYGGNAARIWNDRPSSAAVICRFLRFRGMGQKVATMATNILAREFKIPMSDYFSVDISVDTHVKRVFRRMGLVPPDATNEQIIYAARAINPEFPGILDFPVWDIGRKWCKAKRADCDHCSVCKCCPRHT